MKILIVSERIGGEVQVSFRHVLKRTDKNGAFTEANVIWTTLDGISKQAVAVARVHPDDVPERKMGRKVALARVLWLAGFLRDERRQVWAGLINKRRECKVRLRFQCGAVIPVKEVSRLLAFCPKHGSKLNSVGGYECDQDQLTIRDIENVERIFNRL